MYVYYQLAGDAAGAHATVAKLFARVEEDTGVTGRLLARCVDPHTWMEVYEPVREREAFCARLTHLAAECGMTAHARDGARHVECFVAAKA